MTAYINDNQLTRRMTYENMLRFLQSERPDDAEKALQQIKISINAGDKITDELLILMLKSKTEHADNLVLKYIIDKKQNNVVSKLRVPTHIKENDLFNHALYELWKYNKNHDFDTSKKDAIERFLYIVCKRYIIRNSGKGDNELEDFQGLTDYVLFSMTQKERSLLLEIFDQLGTGCKEILKLRYFEELKYKEISEKADYTEKSARVKASNCITKLKNWIKDTPQLGVYIKNLLTTNNEI